MGRDRGALEDLSTSQVSHDLPDEWLPPRGLIEGIGRTALLALFLSLGASQAEAVGTVVRFRGEPMPSEPDKIIEQALTYLTLYRKIGAIEDVDFRVRRLQEELARANTRIRVLAEENERMRSRWWKRTKRG